MTAGGKASLSESEERKRKGSRQLGGKGRRKLAAFRRLVLWDYRATIRSYKTLIRQKYLACGIFRSLRSYAPQLRLPFPWPSCSLPSSGLSALSAYHSRETWEHPESHAWTRGSATPKYCSPLPNYTISQESTTDKLLAPALMSDSHLAATSISNFQLIINNALEEYEQCTKNDRHAHPLAPQLQACDSPGAIFAILQQQVQGLDQSRSDDRWTKWLDPTINVLLAFSSTLGARVGLVCLRTCAYSRSALLYLFSRYSHPRV